jgi:hypothetical protein
MKRATVLVILVVAIALAGVPIVSGAGARFPKSFFRSQNFVDAACAPETVAVRLDLFPPTSALPLPTDSLL